MTTSSVKARKKPAGQKGASRRPSIKVPRNGTLESWPVVIPPSARDFEGFRNWTYDPDFPDRGDIFYLAGDIYIDMSPEKLDTHNFVKTEAYLVLGGLVRQHDLGHFFTDGARLANLAAEISNEPDAFFVSWDTYTSGKACMIPAKDGKGHIELEGSPDLALEVVSPSSVIKDTQTLLTRYHQAGIVEYWLIEVRGDDVKFDIFRHTPESYVAQPKKSGWIESIVFRRRFKLTRKQDRIGVDSFRLEVKRA